jgi:hypothetical protein
MKYMNKDEENPSITIVITSDENQNRDNAHIEENLNDRYCGLDIDSHFLIFTLIYVSIVLTLYVTS